MTSVRDDILNFMRDPKLFASASVETTQQTWINALHQVALPKLSKGRRELNTDQTEAWEGLAKHRCGLILGPPGTGKTFTLSWMAASYIEARRQNGEPCRVFVTGFTRASIVNMLEAIAHINEAYFDQPTSVGYLGDPPREINGVKRVRVKEADKFLDNECVVLGATSWGLFKMLTHEDIDFEESEGFAAPIFDLVCIDEASQMVVSQGLISLAGLNQKARVLVAGDDRQLPPIREVVERQVEGRSIGGSLYTFMKDAKAPEYALTETYRMNQPLTDFVSEHFYDMSLSPHAINGVRRTPLRESWGEGLKDWEHRVLDPDAPCIVLVHDGPPYGTHNPFEVALTTHLADLLRQNLLIEGQTPGIQDFWEKGLAVISPHRNQNNELRRALENAGLSGERVVETVDRIQGREREAIIASYTVSDSEFALAEANFIFSAERFNVTATRARTKFILIISRALLETLPQNEATFDAAQHIRDYAYSADWQGNFTFDSGSGSSVRVEVRTRSFPDTLSMPTLKEIERPELSEPLSEMNEALEEILNNIKQLAYQNPPYLTVTQREYKKEYDATIEFEDMRTLMRHGHIILTQEEGPYGSFWNMRPCDPPQNIFPAVAKVVKERLRQVILDKGSKCRAQYRQVYSRFDWLAPDGSDRLKELIDPLVEDGDYAWREGEYFNKKRLFIDIVGAEPTQADNIIPPSSVLEDTDFSILNVLEDREARLINFGIFEIWTDVATLAKTCSVSRTLASESLRKLEEHGYVMITDSERIRSRMAELAREVRYVKQRFARNDSDKRPFLVRALRIELKNRNKPKRNCRLTQIEDELLDAFDDTVHLKSSLAALGSMLRGRWGQDPSLATFQKQSIEEILGAWIGRSANDAFVITADTGAGKTEAGLLPLLLGAALDAHRGVKGTRAMLIYPRIRLMENQAQRLVGYLSDFCKESGIQLTLGIQTGLVPKAFNELSEEDSREWIQNQHKTWKPRGESHRLFPFFSCPQCDSDLLIKPTSGTGSPDSLCCETCEWSFDGWMGSKDSIACNPPHFFLAVTESVHQWMHNSKYGRLFGDDPNYEPPRAILADEIHLFSGVHGAQLGYMIQRLLNRVRVNDPQNRRPLALGMSATLGKPNKVWGGLIGRDSVHTIAAKAAPHPNPKAREYFYFVQPEVESRGKDIAGASTTIQSVMCLAHGMRRRTGQHGGYRGLVFLDSIDKLKRLHSDYSNAEEESQLASLRTNLYDDDPVTEQVRLECCGQPEECDAFRNGECWFFAATDKQQVTSTGQYQPSAGLSVCRHPVFSGTGGRVDEMIRTSDIVFSTSSLEVGFDDPDMSLVYQHYSPINLASFVQRKGRGGRGADDRPVTGVTLSAYSPRDTWYFRKPKRMLDAANFEIPINMSNYFVRRGQVLAYFLDLISRERKLQYPAQSITLNATFMATQSRFIEKAFGVNVWQSLDVSGLEELWNAALAAAHFPQRPYVLGAFDKLKDIRENFPWIPSRLFDTINLPCVEVQFEPDRDKQTRTEEEDIIVAFSQLAPGKITRRYGMQLAHWLPPTPGTGTMLSKEECECLELGSSEWKNHIPFEAHEELKGWEGKILRPHRFDLETAGRFKRNFWEPNYAYNTKTKEFRVFNHNEKELKGGELAVNPKTDGKLRGCVVVRADKNSGQLVAAQGIDLMGARLLAYTGNSKTSTVRETGLEIFRAFWGADIELVGEPPKQPHKREYVSLYQKFENKESLPEVYGYSLETEGVQLDISTELVTRFIQGEKNYLSSDEGKHEARWLRGQYLRYLCQAQGRRLGLNSYQSRQLADLMITAVTTKIGRQNIRGLKKRWDFQRFKECLLTIYNDHLQQHPILSRKRVEDLAEAMNRTQSGSVFTEIINKSVSDNEFYEKFLTSVLLNGLSMRLKQLFVRHGSGDERRVVAHARLPIQHDTVTDYVLTAAELGEHGDGTTRTFIERTNEAFDGWISGGLSECHNATEDAILCSLMRLSKGDIETLRTLRPDSPETIEKIQQALGVTEDVPLQTVLSVLFNAEEIEGQVFDLYSLSAEISRISEELASSFSREADVWELVGAVVKRATSTSPTPDDKTTQVPEWSRLYAVYAGLEGAVLEDSLDAKTRLANQVYKLSGRLCVDGCQACLHGGSDLMDDGMAEVSVSRRMLARFEAFVATYGNEQAIKGHPPFKNTSNQVEGPETHNNTGDYNQTHQKTKHHTQAQNFRHSEITSKNRRNPLVLDVRSKLEALVAAVVDAKERELSDHVLVIQTFTELHNLQGKLIQFIEKNAENEEDFKGMLEELWIDHATDDFQTNLQRAFNAHRAPIMSSLILP